MDKKDFYSFHLYSRPWKWRWFSVSLLLKAPWMDVSEPACEEKTGLLLGMDDHIGEQGQRDWA